MARRRRSPDSSDDEYVGSKRIRDEEDVHESLKSLIYHLGDEDLHKLPDNLEIVSDIVKRDASIMKKQILDVLVNCAQNIPEKLTIYVTLIGLINTKDYSLGEEFVESLLKQFKEAVKIGNHEDTKFLLRFISDLINTNVIPSSSVMVLYNVLISLALEDRTPTLCSDWLVYIVMYSLPWSASKLAIQCQEDLDVMMANIEIYITSKRPVDHLGILQVWTSNEYQAQEDYIDCLWEQIKNMRLQGWRERVLWRLYNDPQIVASIQQSRPHKLPQLSLTLSSSVYPIPMVIFRLFDYTDIASDEAKPVTKVDDIPSLDDKNNVLEGDLTKDEMDTSEIKPSDPEELILPGSHSVERFLIEEQYRIIINGFKTNRKLCTKMLLALPMRVKLPISYMIVEAVLGEMLKLPRCENQALYYNCLLMELCRESADSIPLVMAQATEMLFDRIEQMRPTCIERLVNWFSHHLSNFKYQWSWADWSYCSQDSVNKPKTRFIVEVLQKLLRLSFYDYLKSIVPADFARLLPKPPGPVNKYGEGAPRNLACQMQAQQLTTMFKSGTKSDDVITFLESIADSRLDMKEDSKPTDLLDDDDDDIDEAEITKVEPKECPADDDDDVNEVGETVPEPVITKVEEKEIEDTAMDTDITNGHETENVISKTEAVEPNSIPIQDVELYPGVSRRVIDVIMTSLLNVSSKTFTHSFLFIEKYSKVLTSFITDPRDEVEVLHSLFGVWQEQQQYMVVLTQFLLEHKVVSDRAVICWLFSDELIGNLTQFYLFEVISTILELASFEENTAWTTLQDIEENVDESEIQKLNAKRNYARARKYYMDLVKQVLSGLLCRLNNYSTSEAKTNKYKLNMVELLTDLSNQPKPEGDVEDAVDPHKMCEISPEVKYWMLGRVEGLLLSVELPHNYLLKSLDDFFKNVHAPDQVLEIYGVFRSTVNQSSG